MNENVLHLHWVQNVLSYTSELPSLVHVPAARETDAFFPKILSDISQENHLNRFKKVDCVRQMSTRYNRRITFS